jgi:nicotinamidase-related amidase
MKSSSSALLRKEDCALLVIDVQEKLVRIIEEANKSIENIVRLIRFSNIVDIPIVLTEQQNLGDTVKEIRDEMTTFQPVSKITFSCFASEEFCGYLKHLKKKTLIVTGIEAHICVAQTVLDAINEYDVHVVSDAVSSRSINNKEIALDRLRQNNVTITTTEMLIYELLIKAGTNEFRKTLGLLK